MKRFSVCLAGCVFFLLASCGRCDVSIGDIVRWGLVRKPLSPIEYPVFIIPLDGWSEFELKASTNNYRTGVAAVDMVYWFESLGFDAYGGAWTNCPSADLNATLFYCDPDAGNGRAWSRWTNTLTLTEQIGVNGNYQQTVVMIPSLTVKSGATNFWMFPGNEKLIWSYRRRAAAEGETNALGRTIWHPIMPDSWRAAPVVP